MLKRHTPLEIATSGYAAGDLIIASGLAAVATSVGWPKFPIRYRIVEQVRMLAPYGLLGIDDEEEFTVGAKFP